MKKIYIGVSIDIIHTDDKDIDPGREKHGVDSRYLQIIKDAGAIPIPLPHLDDTNLNEHYLNMIDGLLLTGGDDINPLLYHQDLSPKCGRINIKRDTSELNYLEGALKRKMPILGICRGMQLINVFRGGSLFQDLNNQEATITHWQTVKAKYPIQQVTIKEGSLLSTILQKNTTTINSFHHQSVDQVGKNLEVNSYTKDGIIEGIEDKNYPFLLGVQWHPEALQNEDTSQIINSLVEQAKEYHKLK